MVESKKSDVTSSTVSIEAEFLIASITAKEERDVAVVDVPEHSSKWILTGK